MFGTAFLTHRSAETTDLALTYLASNLCPTYPNAVTLPHYLPLIYLIIFCPAHFCPLSFPLFSFSLFLAYSHPSALHCKKFLSCSLIPRSSLSFLSSSCHTLTPCLILAYTYTVRHPFHTIHSLFWSSELEWIHLPLYRCKCSLCKQYTSLPKIQTWARRLAMPDLTDLALILLKIFKPKLCYSLMSSMESYPCI